MRQFLIALVDAELSLFGILDSGKPLPLAEPAAPSGQHAFTQSDYRSSLG